MRGRFVARAGGEPRAFIKSRFEIPHPPALGRVRYLSFERSHVNRVETQRRSVLENTGVARRQRDATARAVPTIWQSAGSRRVPVSRAAWIAIGMSSGATRTSVRVSAVRNHSPAGWASRNRRSCTKSATSHNVTDATGSRPASRAFSIRRRPCFSMPRPVA
jgi:hypothetical protein